MCVHYKCTIEEWLNLIVRSVVDITLLSTYPPELVELREAGLICIVQELVELDILA